MENQNDTSYDTHYHLYKVFPSLVSEDPGVLTFVELLIADGFGLAEAVKMIGLKDDLRCQIVRATAAEPELIVSGFVSLAETEDSFFKPGRDAFKRLRNELCENVREFELASYILGNAPKCREVNARFDLYDLKDRLGAYIEKRTNIVSAEIGFGTVLAAALDCGFDYKRNQDGSLVYINLSDEGYDSLDLDARHWTNDESPDGGDRDPSMPANVIRLY